MPLAGFGPAAQQAAHARL
jgi:hypothetical protein